MIVEDDGYRQLGQDEQAEIGDIAVYVDSGENVSHVGIIALIRTDLERADFELIVLSQWGQDGEYIHRVDDVSHLLGTFSRIYTDRR